MCRLPRAERSIFGSIFGSKSRQRTRRTGDGYYFLTSDARQEIPNYKYKGGDKSLLYKYVLSPLAAFFVENCTPTTIAPNTITLTGLVFMMISYSIMWYYYPALEHLSEEPSWIFALHGIAMLTYQTLDNMDGKQARKTGSSSPLGLLFDHGCDAVNSIFGSIGWIIGMGLTFKDDPLLCAWIILGPFALFFIATWEEYYTGELILPIVNGPSEGIVGGAILSFITSIYGTKFWTSVSVLDQYLASWPPTSVLLPSLRNCDLLVFVAAIGMVNEAFDKSRQVASRQGWKTLLTQIPLWSLIFLTYFAMNTEMWCRMPRTCIHLVSGLFVEIATQMMLDHISHQRYSVSRRLIFQIPFLLLLMIIPLSDKESIDGMLLMYCTALWTLLLFKCSVVVHEICCVLNIFCFYITSSTNTIKDQ